MAQAHTWHLRHLVYLNTWSTLLLRLTFSRLFYTLKKISKASNTKYLMHVWPWSSGSNFIQATSLPGFFKKTLRSAKKHPKATSFPGHHSASASEFCFISKWIIILPKKKLKSQIKISKLQILFLYKYRVGCVTFPNVNKKSYFGLVKLHNFDYQKVTLFFGFDEWYIILPTLL